MPDVPEKHACENCRFWKEHPANPGFGFCRRFPPKLFRVWPDDSDDGYDEESGEVNEFKILLNGSNFPITEVMEWCGEWGHTGARDE